VPGHHFKAVRAQKGTLKIIAVALDVRIGHIVKGL